MVAEVQTFLVRHSFAAAVIDGWEVDGAGGSGRWCRSYSPVPAERGPHSKELTTSACSPSASVRTDLRFTPPVMLLW
eukprot:scaffold138029_cov16-Tisochrysis_lutea.AAC.2